MGKNDVNLSSDTLLHTALGTGTLKVVGPPKLGKSYTKMTACRNGECEGDIIKETDVRYPNLNGRMGSPPVPAEYHYRAFCNVCAIVYDVTILERSLTRTAP